MPVTLTAPVEGKQPGDTYTGPREAWLLASGYAKQANYTGVGVSNTGPAGLTDRSKDPLESANREANSDSVIALGSQLPFKGTNDGVRTGKVSQQGVLPGTDTGAERTPERTAAEITLSPKTGPAGTVVTVEGGGFDDATGVLFDTTAGTAFTKVDDGTLRVTTPAHAAGPVNVTVQDADGNKVKTGAFTYTA